MICVCMYVCVYVRMCVCMYGCMYVCIYLFINCNCVVTRWQYTFTHKNNIEQHN